MFKLFFSTILRWSKLYETERSSSGLKLLHWYARSKDKARYKFATRYIKDGRILNVACGEGHGSEILASSENRIYGLDKAQDAVACARRQYYTERLLFCRGDALRLPFRDRIFTTVVSIETIEHLPDHSAFLAELRRVLVRDGILILSTPDKIVEDRLFHNPHHINLAYKNDMENLLGRYFDVVEVYGQTPLILRPGFMIYPSFVVSSCIFSQRMFPVKASNTLTGTNCIYVCRNVC